MKSKTKDGLKVEYTSNPAYTTMTYLLMPLAINEDHVQNWCDAAKTNIAIISGMHWDDDLTPWPAPGVPKGTAAFKGLAPQLMQTLEKSLMPTLEAEVPTSERNLIGVSLSGLFALWAWMQNDCFRYVCTLSGSYWYEGFVEWMKTRKIPKKTGAILMELGTLEPKSKNKTFATVGTCTAEIVDILKAAGINTTFKWVPGTHYSPIEPRLDLAFEFLSEFVGKHQS